MLFGSVLLIILFVRWFYYFWSILVDWIFLFGATKVCNGIAQLFVMLISLGPCVRLVHSGFLDIFLFAAQKENSIS
jgi:hypothetical protein